MSFEIDRASTREVLAFVQGQRDGFNKAMAEFDAMFELLPNAQTAAPTVSYSTHADTEVYDNELLKGPASR